MIYLKEGSSLKPLRQGISLAAKLQQTGERSGRDKGVIREKSGGDQGASERLIAAYL